MKLLRLHVENFGTLHDLNLSFDSGMNLLYQKNGWGKTTLAVFIKAMLYGLPSSTKRSLDENERKKYMPWQGGAYGGSLEFETARGSFRVERFFGAKESGDAFALYDLATNKPSTVYSDALGEELKAFEEKGIYLAGDGYEVAKKHLDGIGISLLQTPRGLRAQSAASCAAVAKRMIDAGKTVSDREISPSYLRLPQAERERLEREQTKK